MNLESLGNYVKDISMIRADKGLDKLSMSSAIGSWPGGVLPKLLQMIGTSMLRLNPITHEHWDKEPLDKLIKKPKAHDSIDKILYPDILNNILKSMITGGK